MRLVSIVIPVLDEEESLPGTLNDLLLVESELRELDLQIEVILIDDGSTDKTVQVIEAFTPTTMEVHLVRFTRNFGHQAALTAGYDLARGEAIVTMDGDGQHPADLIVSMAQKWIEGWPVVATRRGDQQDLSWMKRKASRSFYRFFSTTAPVDLKPGSSDFRLIDRRVLDVVRRAQSHSMFYRGLIPWLGFETFTLEFEPRKRFAGHPSFTFKKSLFLASAGLITYSRVPLLAVLGSIVLLLFVLMVYASFVLIQRFIVGAMVPGQASILILVMVTAFVQTVTAAVTLLYAYRAFVEVSRQPVYVVNRAPKANGLDSNT